MGSNYHFGPDQLSEAALDTRKSRLISALDSKLNAVNSWLVWRASGADPLLVVPEPTAIHIDEIEELRANVNDQELWDRASQLVAAWAKEIRKDNSHGK